VSSAQANPAARSVEALPPIRRALPNILTVARLLIAGAFFVLLAVWTYPIRELVVSPRHPVWPYLIAAALFGLAAVTDAIDGPLARRWHVVSRFGRVMDPFADKVLVIGAFIMLAGPRFAIEYVSLPSRPFFQVSGVHPWMVVVILSRELLVTSIRAAAEQQGVDFSADWWGKAKMIVQACAIPTILATLGITEVRPGTWGRWLIDATMWLTLGITILSGVPYLVRGIRVMR
jgi:CDP-diacylglycerol--glycerol-3-phosphate 3-phosphatidyltransferase